MCFLHIFKKIAALYHAPCYDNLCKKEEKNMSRTIKEIAEIWETARKPLETERAALIAERNKFLQKHEAEKEGGFIGCLKHAFDKVAPFSAKNRELKRHNTKINAKTADLQRRARSAHEALEMIALEKTRTPQDDAQYAQMRSIISEIHTVQRTVSAASRKCREAVNWERNDYLSKDKGVSGMSNRATFIAIESLQDVKSSLGKLKKYIQISSEASPLIGDIGFGNSLDAIMDNSDYLGMDYASLANLAKLQRAEDSMQALSNQLDSLETRLQKKLDTRGSNALSAMRQGNPDLNSLLSSLANHLPPQSDSAQNDLKF